MLALGASTHAFGRTTKVVGGRAKRDHDGGVVGGLAATTSWPGHMWPGHDDERINYSSIPYCAIAASRLT
jgi:hypothetical protein